LPRNQAIAAAVVWVDGAGMTKRDLGFAQGIAQRGIAVLTYDKRGVGDSGGVYAGPESGTNNASRENLDLRSARLAGPIKNTGTVGLWWARSECQRRSLD
jgi:alpha-beta hydrolase superfamily lysophospholipase